MENKVDVLGVQISDVTRVEALQIVKSWWNESVKRYIVTPNPEFVVYALKEPQFLNLINQADLAPPDGVGLNAAGIILNRPFKERVTGTDLAESLIELAATEGKSIYFLGGKSGAGAKSAEIFKRRFPKLVVSGVFEGDATAEGDIETRKQLNNGHSDLLLVAFGHPKQEYWINRNLDKVNVKVAMGIGGAFDYWSGIVPRAPRQVRQMGLEWLYRLIRQPWRFKRQMALLSFIWLVFKARAGFNPR